MAKTTFASLKLALDKEVNEFEFNDHKIEVKKYLPIEDKIDLVQITLQRSEEDGIYNEALLDMYFNLYIVFLYTNISFTDKQKEDLAKLYDLMQCNGLIPKVIANMEESEYSMLLDYMEKIREDRLKYKQTAAAVLQSIIGDLPANAEAAAQIVDNFNPEQYQNVVDFARAANGGRDIK